MVYSDFTEFSLPQGFVMKSFFFTLLTFIAISASAANAVPIKKIGIILPLTGNAASYGEQFKQGLKLSPSTENFKLIFEDSKFESKTALAAYQKLRAVDQVDFLISFGGSTCEVLNQKSQQDKLLHIAAGCNTAEFNLSDSYNFRLDVNEIIAAEKTAEYLTNGGIKTVAFIYINNSWAGTIIKHTKKAFNKADINIVDEITFSDDSSLDLKTSLIKLKSNPPQKIFLVSLPELTPIVLKQIKELGISIPIMSNISIENPEVIRLAGKNADEITYLSVKATDSSRTDHPVFYKEFPDGNPFAAWGYDSLLLISKAAEAEEPRKKLQKLKDFSGAFNYYSFDSNGELKLPYEIRVIKDGHYLSLENL